MSDTDNSLDVRLSHIEGTVDQMSERLGRVESNIDTMNERFDGMNERMDNRFDQLRTDIRRWFYLMVVSVGVVTTAVVTVLLGVFRLLL